MRRWFVVSPWVRYLVVFAVGAVFAAAVWQPQFWAYWRAEAEQEIEAHETCVVQQVRAGQAEARKVAAARIAADIERMPPSAPYTREYQPPEGLSMPAKTQVTMGEAWNCTLEALNQDDDKYIASAPLKHMSAGSIGGTVLVKNDGNIYPSPSAGGWFLDGGRMYYPFMVTLIAGGVTQTLYYGLDIGSGVGPPPQNNNPHPDWVAVTSMDVDFSLSLQGFYLKSERTATVYPDRQTMDWSDLSGDERWYAGPTTTADVTVTGPDGRTLTSSTPLYIPEGDEIEIGSSYAFGATITLNRAPVAGVPYATVRDIKWGSTALSTPNVSLYNPGDSDDDPAGDGWSRTQTTTSCYRVYGGDSISMEGVSIRGAESPQYHLSLGAPLIVDVEHIDGTWFDHDGPAAAPAVEFTSNGITWTSPTEYDATKFTGNLSLAQYSDSRLYDYEWQKLTSNNISVRVTEDYRDTNGEDVGNDVTGGDAESLNDQLCALVLWPLTATDRVSDPWWLPGISLEHLSAIDVNDTYGQPRRASWWLGGDGVTVDPTDNDVWSVASGATAPTLTRNWRTQFWKRMERLGDWLDDPEAEHNRDWPIMLKANLDIGTTLDDADWWTEPIVRVSGAGTGSVDGDYSEYGSSGGQQQYGTGPVYVRYNRALSQWEIVDGGAVYYTCPTLTGTWVVQDGSAPAPTVVLVQHEEADTASMLYEDVYNWDNYSYLLMTLDAPRNETIQVDVDYRVPLISDPCFTGFDYEFGDLADLWGGWSYSYQTFRLTWEVSVTAGSHAYLLDLMLNQQQQMPCGSYRIQVVQKVTIRLPENDTGAAEEWELEGLELVEDPGDGARSEPDPHLLCRYKPSWSWIDPNYRDTKEDAEHADENWFGFGAIVDGKPALNVDYGYIEPFGKTAVERGLLYIQCLQHNPDYSGDFSRLDYAKSLGRWYNELSWQEGFVPTWPATDPLYQAENEDADDETLASAMYWWDMRQSNESEDWADVRLGLCAGNIEVAAGIPYKILFYKYPRGCVHGVARNEACTERQRDETGIVDLYGRETGGAWAVLEAMDTDAHGRFRSTPVREKDWEYRVGTGGDTLTTVNRSYAFDFIDSGAFNWEGYLDLDECGVTWLVAVGQGRLHVYWIGAGADGTRHEVTQPATAGGHSRPSIAVAGGALYVAATLGSDTVIYRSLDRGETWAQLATDLGDGITLGTIAWRETGEVLLCGVDAADDVVMRIASDGYLTRDDLTAGVDEITIAASAAGKRSCVVRQSDGSILAAVEGSGQVDLYRCRDFGTGFAAV